jgi:hypothetical protein
MACCLPFLSRLVSSRAASPSTTSGFTIRTDSSWTDSSLESLQPVAGLDISSTLITMDEAISHTSQRARRRSRAFQSSANHAGIRSPARTRLHVLNAESHGARNVSSSGSQWLLKTLIVCQLAAAELSCITVSPEEYCQMLIMRRTS